MEPTAGRATSIREAEAISAQDVVVTGDPLTNLVGQKTVKVRRGHEGSFGSLQLAGNEGGALRPVRVEEVELFHVQRLATKLGPRGDRPNCCIDTPITCKQLPCLACPRNADTGCEQLSLRTTEVRVIVDFVDALNKPVDIKVFGLCGLVNGLVVHRQVVHDIRIASTCIAVHTFKAVGHDVPQFVGISGIVCNKCMVGGCQNGGVTIHVLQAFTGEGCTPSSCADNEAL